MENRIKQLLAHFPTAAASPTTLKHLNLTIQDRVAHIEMKSDGKKKYHVLVNATLDELNAVLLQLEKDDNVHVVILSGMPNFASGGDVKEFAPLVMKDVLMEKVPYDIVLPRFRKPIIAAANGYCIGAGLEIVMTCDIVLASEDAIFSIPEINMGYNASSGGTTRFTKLVGKSNAMATMLTAEMFSAKKAMELGVVNHVYPTRESLMAEAMKLAKKIAAKPLVASALIKRSVKMSLEVGESMAWEFER